MPTNPTVSLSPVAHLNGRAATADELAPLAFAGYAHFTAMQVRDGRVRGLDLHLARLRSASLELFGQALPDERIAEHLRTALAEGPGDVSLTATVFSAEGEFTTAATDDDPLRVLVRTAPPTNGPAGPLSLALVAHERTVPEIKHVGEIAKTYYLRQAVAEGHDDAAFVDRAGRLSEASIWNLAFWDGEAVVWPKAAMLGGTTMAILHRRLDALGAPQYTREITAADLPALSGATVMNSWTPSVPVHQIANTQLPDAPAFYDLLHHAYNTEPPTAP